MRTFGGQSGCGCAKCGEKSASVPRGENPSSTGLKEDAGRPSFFLSRAIGAIHNWMCRFMRAFSATKGQRPRLWRCRNQGADASTEGSYVEKKIAGCRATEIQRRLRASATIGPA